MTAWIVELSEFGLKYESIGPMKTQFLVNFHTELPTVAEKNGWWSLNVDIQQERWWSRSDPIRT